MSIRQKGFSLVELMIALAAGLIVSASVVIFAMSSMKSNADYVQSTRLTQELRNTLDMVSRDVRRAGYDDDALKYLGSANVSPFAPVFVQNTTEADGSNSACILYAYDRTSVGGTKGQLDVANGEARGMRRELVSVNGKTVGVIEYGVSNLGASGTKPSCGAAALDYTSVPVSCANNWCPLSDTRTLDISNFTVTPQTNDLGSVAAGQLKLRSYDVTVAGRLSGKNDFLRSVTTRVRVQADCNLSTFGNCTVAP